jgi:hypothetical protein
MRVINHALHYAAPSIEMANGNAEPTACLGLRS